MRTFRISEAIEIVCEAKSTRSGFKHEATLLRGGIELQSAKVCYLNRTWESYEYQTVLYKVVEKCKDLSEEERQECNAFIKGDHTDWTPFKTVGAIASLGDLLCNSQKEKNDWKARMIRAGLGNSGLDMPEDWDSLDEDTKELRLNEVMKLLNSPKEAK